jgi:hypothetical protein
VRAEREVEVELDVALCGGACGAAELFVGQPLGVEVVLASWGIGGAFSRKGGAELFGPVVPIRMERFLEGTKGGVTIEVRMPGPETFEGIASCGLGTKEATGAGEEKRTFKGEDSAVIDQGLGSETVDTGAVTRGETCLELGDAFKVEVKFAPKETADRRIRAWVERVVEEERQEGQRSGDFSAVVSDPTGEGGEIGIIARAPVTRRAEGVERGEHTPGRVLVFGCE